MADEPCGAPAQIAGRRHQGLPSLRRRCRLLSAVTSADAECVITADSKGSPISLNQKCISLHICGMAQAVKAPSDRGGIHQAIRLSERGQAADCNAASSATESPDAYRYCMPSAVGRKSAIVPMRPHSTGRLTCGALSGRGYRPMQLLARVTLGAIRGNHYRLHLSCLWHSEE